MTIKHEIAFYAAGILLAIFLTWIETRAYPAAVFPELEAAGERISGELGQ